MSARVTRLAAGVVAREAGESDRHHIGVMKLLHPSLFCNIQPQTMHQVHVFALHRRRVRANAEGVDFAIRMHQLQYELAFGFGRRFPGLSEQECLFLRTHPAREPDHHRR